MNDDVDLPARSVCRHRYPGGPHTYPTMLDIALYSPMWWVACAVYRRTGFLPCRQARYMAVLGLVYFPIHEARAYVATGDIWHGAGILTSIIIQLYVIGTTFAMERLHKRLADDETNPSMEDIKLLYGVRRWRIVFTVVWLLPPYQLEPLITNLLFIVWPMFAVLLGGPPTPNLWDKAKSGTRRLRELAAAIRPRPAFGGGV